MLTIDATFIFVLISFIIFLFLMHLICYKPILRIINEREKLLYKNKETLDKTRQKTESVIQNIEKEISGAKLEGATLLKETSSANDREKEEALAIKKEELSYKLNEFDSALALSAKSATESIKPDIEGLVKEAVSKVLKIDPNEITVDKSKISEILK